MYITTACICSAQSGNLRNLQIALRKLKIHRLRANLQIGTQSADCAILIAQSVDCAIDSIVQVILSYLYPSCYTDFGF